MNNDNIVSIGDLVYFKKSKRFGIILFVEKSVEYDGYWECVYLRNDGIIWEGHVNFEHENVVLPKLSTQ